MGGIKMTTTTDWKQLREQFPALRGCTYLNTATYGQLPLRTVAAVQAHFARRDALACRDFLGWFDDMDDLRALVGRLIHCQPADVAFLSSAAEALSLFLGGLDWKPGDKIATLPDEFPNQFYYGRFLGQRGVELVEVPELSELPVGTKAVVLSTASYSNGYTPDLDRICRMAREAGALIYIDGTQSVGALRFDVGALRPDMFAVDPYKWGLAPNGASYMYVSPELRRVLDPAVIGWRSDKGWRSVDSLNKGAPEFPDGADRYEGGMLNVPSLYGLAESIRMMLEIGPEVIEARVLDLAEKTGAALEAVGATIVNKGTHIVAARFEGLEASALARGLAARGIIVAARHGNLRVAAHIYNDESDIAALVHEIGLAAIQALRQDPATLK